MGAARRAPMKRESALLTTPKRLCCEGAAVAPRTALTPVALLPFFLTAGQPGLTGRLPMALVASRRLSVKVEKARLSEGRLGGD